MTKLESDFSLICDKNAPSHEAFPFFKKVMEGRHYGEEPLNDAWIYFRIGWDQHDTEKDPRPPTTDETLLCSDLQWCNYMKRALEGEDSLRGRGLTTQTIMNLTTGKMTGYCVGYRTTSKKPLLILLYCPWCREPVIFNRVQEDEKTDEDQSSKDDTKA